MAPDFCAFISGATRLAHEELRVKADFEAFAPVGQLHVLDRRGWPLDAGIVDQHVEAAEILQRRRRTRR